MPSAAFIPTVLYDPLLERTICKSDRCGCAIPSDARRHLRQVHNISGTHLDDLMSLLETQKSSPLFQTDKGLQRQYLATTDKSAPAPLGLPRHPHLPTHTAWKCTRCHEITGLVHSFKTAPAHVCKSPSIGRQAVAGPSNIERHDGEATAPAEPHTLDARSQPAGTPTVELAPRDEVAAGAPPAHAPVQSKVQAQTIYAGNRARFFRVLDDDADVMAPQLPFEGHGAAASTGSVEAQEGNDAGVGHTTTPWLSALEDLSVGLARAEGDGFSSSRLTCEVDAVHGELNTEALLEAYQLGMAQCAALTEVDTGGIAALLRTLMYDYMVESVRESRTNMYVNAHTFLGRDVRMSISEDSLASYSIVAARLLTFVARACTEPETARLFTDQVRGSVAELDLASSGAGADKANNLSHVHRILASVLFCGHAPSNKIVPLFVAAGSVRAHTGKRGSFQSRRGRPCAPGAATAEQQPRAVYRVMRSLDLPHLLNPIMFLAKCFAIREVYVAGEGSQEGGTAGRQADVDQVPGGPGGVGPGGAPARADGRGPDDGWGRILMMTSNARDNGIRYVGYALSKCHHINRTRSMMTTPFNPCLEHPRCAFVDNIELSQEELSAAIGNLHREADALLRTHLLLGLRLGDGYWAKLGSLDDAVRNSVPNFSFSEHPGNAEFTSTCARRIFQALRHTPLAPYKRRAAPAPSGDPGPSRVAGESDDGPESWIFPDDAAREYLGNCDRLHELMFTMLHLTSGGPPRATEWEPLLVRNTARQMRHVFITAGGYLTVITSYHKSQTLHGGSLKHIARFPCAVTSGIVLTYLVLVRPLEILLRRQLYATDGYDAAHKAMLTREGGASDPSGAHGPATEPAPAVNVVSRMFQRKGTAVTNVQLRAWFRAHMNAHGIDISYGQYRHYHAGIVNNYITQPPPQLLEQCANPEETAEDAAACITEPAADGDAGSPDGGASGATVRSRAANVIHAQAAHALPTAQRLYARTEKDPVHMSAYQLHEFRYASNAWHRWLRLVTGTPCTIPHDYIPVPSSREATAPTVESAVHAAAEHVSTEGPASASKPTSRGHKRPHSAVEQDNPPGQGEQSRQEELSAKIGAMETRLSAQTTMLDKVLQLLTVQNRRSPLPEADDGHGPPLYDNPVQYAGAPSSAGVSPQRRGPQTTPPPTVPQAGCTPDGRVPPTSGVTPATAAKPHVPDPVPVSRRVSAQSDAATPSPRVRVVRHLSFSDSPRAGPSPAETPDRGPIRTSPITGARHGVRRDQIADPLVHDDNDDDDADNDDGSPARGRVTPTHSDRSDPANNEVPPPGLPEIDRHILPGAQAAKHTPSHPSQSPTGSNRVQPGGGSGDVARQAIDGPHLSQLLNALRAAVGDPRAMFRSDAHRDEVHAAVHIRDDRLVVQPTGSGKTLLYIIPALMHPTKVIIVICPLLALQDDLLRRCNAAGLDTVTFEDREHVPARIVITMVEATESPEYTHYVRSLVRQRRLHCIVVEEAHLVLLSASYRRAMTLLYLHLRPSGARRIPVLAITATSPPVLTKRIMEFAGISEEDTFMRRYSTNRSNIAYLWFKVSSGLTARALLIVEKMSHVARLAPESPTPRHRRAGHKFIVYTPTRNDAEAMASKLTAIARLNNIRLRAEHLHGRTEPEERKARMQRWAAPDERAWHVMCATNAFGCGIDCNTVRAVFHIERPALFVEYAQESGRAGRDGLPAYSYVFATGNDRRWIQENITTHNKHVPSNSQLPNSQKPEEFGLFPAIRDTHQTCRRHGLSTFIDGRRLAMRCTDVAQQPSGAPLPELNMLCDVCTRASLLRTGIPRVSATRVPNPQLCSATLTMSLDDPDAYFDPEQVALDIGQAAGAPGAAPPQPPPPAIRKHEIDASRFTALADKFLHSCAPCSLNTATIIVHNTWGNKELDCYKYRCFLCGSRKHPRAACPLKRWRVHRGSCVKCNLITHNRSEIHLPDSFGSNMCPFRHMLHYAHALFEDDQTRLLMQRAIPEMRSIAADDENALLNFLVNYDNTTGPSDRTAAGLATVVEFMETHIFPDKMPASLRF